MYSSQDRDRQRILLVRHGQSEANAQRIYQGQNDSPLSSLGRTQAVDLAKRLRINGYSFDQIYSSDLIRAAETTQIILTQMETVGCPVIYTPLLREMDLGAYSGRKMDTLNADEQAYLDTIWKERSKRFPGGESVNMLVRRLMEFMIRVENLPTSSATILVVTHGGPIYHILSSILGLLEGFSFGWFENCKVNEVERINSAFKDPEWKLLTINDNPWSE